MFVFGFRSFLAVLLVCLGVPQVSKADFHKGLIRDITRGVIVDQITRDRNSSGSNATRSGQGSNGSSASTSRGSAENQVAKTQRYLNDLGFDAGVVDGVAGRGTRNAIAEYQSSRGMEPTGTLTRLQFAGLQAEHARKSNPAAGLDLLPAEVYAAQLFLTELGFSTGGADGKWGPNSQRALDAYRRQNGLPMAPGIVPNDLAALSSSAVGSTPVGRFGGDTQTAVAGIETVPEVEFDASEYAHIGTYRQIPDSTWLNRFMALQMLRAEPELMDNPNNARRWFDANVISREYGTNPTLADAYLQGNDLEKEDIFNEFIAQAPAEYLSTTPISTENPLPLAIYQQINFQPFIEGKGLPIRLEPIFQKDWEIAHLHTRLRINANANGTDYLPVSREQAKRWIDRSRDPKRALVQVFWGRLTGIGNDDTLSSFATLASGGLRLPSTFVLERVTLHYQFKSRQADPKIEPEVLFEWRLENAPGATSVSSGLEFAQNLGLTIRDGHVYPGEFSGQNALNFKTETVQQRGKPYEDRFILHRLLALTKLSVDPDWAQEGNVFAGLAYLLFDDAKLTSFFGPNATNMRRQPPPRYMIDANFQMVPLGDEFATIRAKTAFFDSEFDSIKKQAPVWPMPVLNVARVNLGQYDIEQRAFPIQNLPAGPYAYRMSTLVGGSDMIASADWIGNLPTALPMPWEEAEQLSRELDRYRAVYLGWTSDLDMSQDGSALDQIAPRNFRNKGRIRPGRATLKTVGLYQDPELTKLIVEIDPASVTTSSSVDFDAIAASQELLSLPLMSAQHLFVEAMDAIGSPDALKTVLEFTPDVQNANEFTRDEARKKVMAEYEALPRDAQPKWLEATVVLGEYDTTEGFFRVAQVERYQYNTSLQYRAQMSFELATPLEGLALTIPMETARSIVEQNGRRLNVRFRTEVDGFTDKSKPDGRVHFVATLAPQEMYFYRNGKVDGTSEVVAQLNAAEEAEKTASSTFDVADFGGLSAQSLLFDPHVHDLLRIKYSDIELTPEILDGMMLNAARSFGFSGSEWGQLHSGPQFFENFPANATAEQRAAVLESFENWITAKSRATGLGLTIRASLNTPSDCRMGFIRDATRMTRIERFPGIFAGLPIEADVQALQKSYQSMRNTGNMLYLERGYLSSYGGIDAQTGYCSAGNGLFARGIDQQLFVLKGAAYRTIGGASDQAQVQDIDIRIGNVEFLFDGDAEALRVTGDVIETRRLDRAANVVATIPSEVPADGALVVPAAFSERMPAPEQPEQPVAASEPQPTRETPQAKATETAAVQTETGIVTDARSDFDLLGVKTGISFDQAEAIIRQEVSVTATFASKQSPETPHKMGYVRSLVSSDGSQVFSFFGPTEDGPVLAIARVVQNLEGSWPVDAILGSLEGKYSENYNIANNQKSVWWHGKQSSVPDACPRLPLMSPDKRFFDVDVAEGDPGSLNWFDLVTLTPGVPMDKETELQNRGECGSFVQFDTPTSALGGDTNFFTLFMYDPGVSSTVKLPEPKKEKVNIKF